MSKSTKPVKILFIGNSFTARNDLPYTIAELAEERGIKVEPRLLSIGGASLRNHWNKGVAPAAIKTGDVDYVVLQEQSTLPAKNAARMRENVLLFDPLITAAGAKTVLYMTWARKHTPEKQDEITKAYETIGREIGALVVPVGEAWRRFISEHTSSALHDKDQSHPTIAGSYLAACVFLVKLFDQSPVGLDVVPAGLTAADARLLQRSAAEIKVS